MLLAEEQLSWR